MRFRILAAGILSLGPLIGSAAAMDPQPRQSEAVAIIPEEFREGLNKNALNKVPTEKLASTSGTQLPSTSNCPGRYERLWLSTYLKKYFR